jgi:hypothetical protein
MPDTLHESEVSSKTDPSVAKQYDSETPKDQQIKQFFEMADGKKICMLNTYRNGVGEFFSTRTCAHVVEQYLTIIRPCRSFHGHCST